jgi:hypothetical protein
MPNYITNKLEFKGNEEEVKNVFEYLKGKENDRYIDFNTIVKTPDHIFQGNLGNEEREKYGKNNWHDWNLENWGTKWNAFRQELIENGIKFETAWNGVLELIKKASKDNKEIVFNYCFADEDFGYNIGAYIIKNGEVLERIEPEGGSEEALIMAEKILGYKWEDEEE